MCAWSDAADPRNHARNFLYRHSLDEFLESAQFGNLEVAVGYASVVCEKDVNFSVSFKPCYGINRNAFHSTFLVMSDAGIPNRLKAPKRIGDLVDDPLHFSLFFGLDDRCYRGYCFGALIQDTGRRAVTAAAGNAGNLAAGIAAASRDRTHAQESLFQEAGVRIGLRGRNSLESR